MEKRSVLRFRKEMEGEEGGGKEEVEASSGWRGVRRRRMWRG